MFLEKIFLWISKRYLDSIIIVLVDGKGAVKK